MLDEPTAGVDVELRKSLWTFIRRLHREGHTIVLTTHYLEEAEALCHRIAILNRGKLAALDTKQALLARGIGRTRRVCISCSSIILLSRRRTFCSNTPGRLSRGRSVLVLLRTGYKLRD